jgi:hypothetical protein
VPDDLNVHVPSLDDAMLSLLGGGLGAAPRTTVTEENLVGGRR